MKASKDSDQKLLLMEQFSSILTVRRVYSGRMCPQNLWWQNGMKYSGTDSPVRLFKSVNILETDSVLIIRVKIWLDTHTVQNIWLYQAMVHERIWSSRH